MFFYGCNLFQSPTAPSGVSHNLTSRDLSWSPYLNIHATGEAFDVYKEVLPRMVQNGTLRGVRIGTVKSEAFNNHVIDMIRDIPGIEVLYIIDNYYLFDNNIEQVIDDAVKKYPEIRYFQIGNEITTILDKSGPQMNIEEYMVFLNRAYDHVVANYSNITLLSQATLGAGTYGGRELERMAELGLSRMSPQKLIIGVNAYTPTAVSQYPGVINGKLRSFRIWVTETGSTVPDEHIAFVRDSYPKLGHYLRAERIYWYAMWGGDPGCNGFTPCDAGFSLFYYPGRFPDYQKGSLLKLLMGEE